MIYTRAMKQEIKRIKVPHDLPIDTIEYNVGEPFIALRFYESHWRYLTELERVDCLTYMMTVKGIIEAHGVPVTLDPVYDVPGGQTL